MFFQARPSYDRYGDGDLQRRRRRNQLEGLHQHQRGLGERRANRLVNGPSSTTMKFDLYSDSARTTIWGSRATGYHLPGATLIVPRNTTRTATVFARLLGSQQAAFPGSYTSTFTTNPVIRYAIDTGAVCPTGGLNANAATSPTATATVVSTCTLTGPSTLNFGNTQGVLTGNVDAQPGTPISVQCTNTTPTTSVSMPGPERARRSRRAR